MSTVADDVLEEALAVLCANYIFPEKAAEAAAAIRARRAGGEYAGLDEEALAERVTTDLFAVCADKHLRIRARNPFLVGEMTDDERGAAWLAHMRLINNGIARVERLDGNVGYLDLRSLVNPGAGAPAITAAMELVSHTHALIIDLRRNGGGSPEGVIYWNSYLFPDSNTHLNDIYDGASGETRQYWSLSYLPGERYLDRPVYVLSSAETFSGGEEFCYNLKVRRRATLIGETTRGGAHPSNAFSISSTLEISVPYARSVNPVTGTNWEGTGVEPDIAVPAAEAYSLAYEMALRHVLTTGTSPAVLAEARATLATLTDA